MDYIFDIDGTLLDISHRLKFITGPNEHYDTAKKDWKSFRDPKEKRWDEPIMEVINILIALKAAGNRVIILSGRTKNEEADTRDTLRTWIPDIDDVPMYMRSDRDRRKDYLTKSDLLDKVRADGYDPKMVFDDRPSVITMWHVKGLRVADVRDPSKGDF